MIITTRQKILDYLKRNKTVTSREIARTLQMTPANARHHLGILASDGRVEVVSERRGGRGRPEKVYRLAKTLLGDNLSVLMDAILTEAGGSVDLEAVGKHVAGEGADSEAPLMRRLAFAVDRLNEMHYQARWEAGAGGPRIILGHCPYASVVNRHPQVCEIDAALLRKLLRSNVEQTARLETGAGGRLFCGFVLLNS